MIKSPLQLVQLQNVASFNEIGQKVHEKLHSQKLGVNWAVDKYTDRAESKTFFDYIYET